MGVRWGWRVRGDGVAIEVEGAGDTGRCGNDAGGDGGCGRAVRGADYATGPGGGDGAEGELVGAAVPDGVGEEFDLGVRSNCSNLEGEINE